MLITLFNVLVIVLAFFSASATAAEQTNFGEARKLSNPTRHQTACLSGATPAPGYSLEDPEACECHLLPEQKLYEKSVEKPDVSDLSSGVSPTIVGPARQSGACGIRTTFLNTVESGVIRLPTSFGSKEYVPLYLSDKTKFYCVAIRPFTPCLVSSRIVSGGIELVLTTERPAGRTAHVFVPSDGDRTNVKSDDDNFVVVRRQSPYQMVRSGDVVKEIKDFAAGVRCASDCPAAKKWAAERRILQLVRVERKPLGARRGEPDADLRAFVTQTLDGLPPSQRLITRAIMSNEIGYIYGQSGLSTSPYEVTDAGGASGLSFGHFQVDLATNSAGEKYPFREAIRSLASATPDDKALVTIGRERWFEHRVQTFSVDLLLAFYRSVRPLYDLMREGPNRANVDRQIVEYAAGRSGCLKILAETGEPLASDPVARLYILDVANHFGGGHEKRLADAAKDAMNDGRNVATAMLDDMKKHSDYGRDPTHHEELDNRLKNIRGVVASASDSEKHDLQNGDCVIAGIARLR